MKRIDLHLHTKNIKGDGTKRIISEPDFIEKMESNNIGICAITNHNYFDVEEFRKIRDAKKSFIIFTGIELDVFILDKNETRHIIVVGDPDNENQFKEVFNVEEKNAKNFSFGYEGFIDSIKKFNKDKVIIIPHFYDKGDKRKVTDNEKEKLKTDLSEYTMILEPAKVRSMGIINAHNELSLIGSDVKDWNVYSELAKQLPELKFFINSYGKFYELTCDTKHFVESFLNGCSKEIIKVESSTLDLYKDINIIFGGKGSGKTILLKNYLYPELINKGYKTILHEGKDYQTDYSNMLKSYDDKTNVDEEIKTDIMNDLSYIFSYSESPSQNFIERVIKYCNDTSKNALSKLIFKTEAVFNKTTSDNNDDTLRVFDRNITSIDKVIEINNSVRGDVNEHKVFLNKELVVLKNELKCKLRKDLRNYFSISHTDAFLKSLKEIIEKKTGKVGKPNNYAFLEKVNERKKLLISHNRLIDNLKKIETGSNYKIGTLPDKGDIYYQVKIRVLKKNEERAKQDTFSWQGYGDNKRLLSKIEFFDYRKFRDVNTYYSIDEKNKDINELFNQLVTKECKVINNNIFYKPSEGEKSILSITGILFNMEYDCYLFDEIERGLGNKYIASDLLKQIKTLRDFGKYVVLSTHNANIAISTMPSQAIYCNYKNDSKNNIYYQGNMFTNELVSIDSDVKIEWEETAIEHLEGGEGMFGIRRNVWS